MPCEIAFSLLQESLVGEIADDWDYLMRIEVHNNGLVGAGGVRVPAHTLKPGTTQSVPVVGTVVLPAGEGDSTPWVRLILEAKDVEFLIDDQGSNELVVQMERRKPGVPHFVAEPSLTARVKESPKLKGGQAALTIKCRLTARCG